MRISTSDEDEHISEAEPASYNKDNEDEVDIELVSPVLVEPTSANPPLLPIWPAPDDNRWGFQSLPVSPGHIIRKDTKLDGEVYICDGRLYVKKDPNQWTSYVLGHCRSPEAYNQIVARLETENRVSELLHLKKFWDEKREGHPFHDERHQLTTRKRPRLSELPEILDNQPVAAVATTFCADPQQLIRNLLEENNRLLSELAHLREHNASTMQQLAETNLQLREDLSRNRELLKKSKADEESTKKANDAEMEQYRQLYQERHDSANKEIVDAKLQTNITKAENEALTQVMLQKEMAIEILQNDLAEQKAKNNRWKQSLQDMFNDIER